MPGQRGQPLHHFQGGIHALQPHVTNRQQDRLAPPRVGQAALLHPQGHNAGRVAHALRQVVGAEELLKGEVGELVAAAAFGEQAAPLTHGAHEGGQLLVGQCLAVAAGQAGAQPARQLPLVNRAPRLGPGAHHAVCQEGQQPALFGQRAAPIGQFVGGVAGAMVPFG